MSIAVSMNGISKRFGAVQALDNVDLHVHKGTIHGLVGENGAGKTTLMRILYGSIHADAGALEVEGKRAQFSNSKQAIEAGIGMVSQHYGIIPELTCLQNLILGAEGGPVIHPREAANRAREMADRMGFAFEWDQPAEGLSPAGAQKLEILKLLWRNARIMILDEPTAMLSPSDGAAFFESLQHLAGQGTTVILVTHRLPEVIEHCSTVTVLRSGRRVAEMPVAETNGRDLAQLIVGGAIAEPSPRIGVLGDSILTVRDLTVRGEPGRVAVKNANLSLRAGEVVGIAGVDGSGQRELFLAIAGLTQAVSGTVLFEGKDIGAQSTANRLEAGLRIIPEDRHREGLIEEWSLEENAALGTQRQAPFANGSRIDGQARRREAAAIAERFDTRHGGLAQPMLNLSGGNQQRFVAARAIHIHPKLILAFQPARGLDLNSTTRVYDGIRAACDKGAAALVVSFNLDELLEYCDRIVAMNRGEIYAPPVGHELDRDTIGRLMVGAA